MATVKEIKLKKNGAMVSPVVLIDSVKNLDGTKYKDTVTSALNGKANSSHTHDDRYYTESEITNLLNGKANSSHTHDYVTLTDKSCTTSNSNQITLTSLNKGEWLSINCRTNPPDNEGSNSSTNRRYIKLPSGGKFVLVVSEQEIGSNVSDIKSGIYAGGHIFDNSYWDDTYTRYSGSVYLNGFLLRLS